VAGVVAEFIIAGIHPLYDSFLEQWGSAIAGAIVAIGIVGEIAFGVWDSRIQTELRNRSNERAAQLEKDAAGARERVAEIEQVAAWRHISPEQRDQISAALHNNTVLDIDLLIEYQYSDAEAWSYSAQLATIFGKSGVAAIRHGANMHFGQIVFGVRMAGGPEVKVAEITAGFAKAGIAVHTFEMDLSTHLPRNEKPPNLYVFVGPKPPPKLAAWDSSATTNSKVRE
jgi:hypothetical protein